MLRAKMTASAHGHETLRHGKSLAGLQLFEFCRGSVEGVVRSHGRGRRFNPCTAHQIKTGSYTMLDGVCFVKFRATSGATALQKAVVTGVLATLSAIAVASDTKSVAYCDPPRGSDTATVLRVCGKPISTHYARGAFKYAEWVYRDSIVGFVNDQVSYVLDLRE